MMQDPDNIDAEKSLAAAGLSLLLPGLGQIYRGERSKGIAVACSAVGLIGAIALSLAGPALFRSWLSALMLAGAYLALWIPAIVDAYGKSPLTESVLGGQKAWYVVVMLLAVGPMAFPLLWQSPRFSKESKIVWTILISIVALAAIVLILLLGPILQGLGGLE